MKTKLIPCYEAMHELLLYKTGLLPVGIREYFHEESEQQLYSLSRGWGVGWWGGGPDSIFD